MLDQAPDVGPPLDLVISISECTILIFPQATPPNGLHETTLIADTPSAGSIPPPLDSPPPLPPDYAPLEFTTDFHIGPSPVAISDSYSSMANTSDTGTPSLTVQNPTPEPDDRSWREDSFEDF